MRPIKFRAWKSMESLASGEILEKMVFFKLTELDGDYIIPSGSYLHDEVIVMQYTGLKDKNGKEIYEGDILKDSLGCMWFIHFGRGKFLSTREDNEITWDAYLYSEQKEVIGNLYENPELLEKK